MCVSIGWYDIIYLSMLYRDDTLRFTDLMNYEEKKAIKLDEQPILLRASGSTIVVVCTSYD